jgi:hypothetical protein
VLLQGSSQISYFDFIESSKFPCQKNPAPLNINLLPMLLLLLVQQTPLFAIISVPELLLINLLLTHQLFGTGFEQR